MYVARSYEGTKVYHLRYIVDFRSAIWLPYDHRSVANTDARSAPNKQGRVCFFRMAPSLDGERARQLANTLLGAKDGGHHHPKRTSALTSLRCQIRCCALATTIPWFYELIDRQLAAETVAQAQRRLVRRKLVNTTARS